VLSYLPDSDPGVLEKAYLFAENAHRHQTRRSGEPYFVHPVAVAETLTDLRLDVASVCAGLLHDVVEDTDTPIEEIGREFGDEVAQLVDGLTKLNKINFYSKEDRQAENIRKVVVAMSRDVRVLLVKLCDRLDNMRTMEHMKLASAERISRETSEIYAPLAHRLGMNEIKSELEDLSLRYLEPEAFQSITKHLGAGEKERSKYINGVSRTLRHLFGERGLECKVGGRPRHVTSVFRRMRDLKCECEQLHDLITFQVCVESVTDCYTALGVIHSKWLPVPGRFKDYIALPKHNRYQSLHTTVIGPGHRRLEVQIRTHEMHQVAEKGVLAHWEYRAQLSGRVRPSEAKEFSWLKEMVTYQRDVKDPAEFLEMIKNDLFPDEVFVFTPKGDIRMFPRGATPIDFAYSIHTELGDHCAGARINSGRVANSYKLHNGDVIEVVSDQTITPSKDWLENCVTARARSRVRNYLRANNRRKSINLGRELLGAELQRSGMSLAKLLRTEPLLDEVIETLKVHNLDALLLGLGFGKLDAHDVVELVCRIRRGADRVTPVPELKTGALEKLMRRFTGQDVDGIRVDGLDGKLVRYAKCCNPLPGDAIIGFITRGRGVAVHRRDCLKVFNTTDPERRVAVNWSSHTTINRPVSLKILTKNTPGILANVTQVFSTQKINLSEVNCHASDDGSAENTFTFLARDVSQVRNLMKSISRVGGVVSVERE
jgi:GTP pyrophosphokinase